MLDQIDRQILGVVRNDGRISHRELGRVVGLSPNAAGARLKRLIDRGVIVAFQAVVDPLALGRGMEASIDCRLRDPEQHGPMESYVLADDRIIEAFHLTGKVDFRIRVQVASTTELDELLTALRNTAGVAETDTRLVLHKVATA